MRQGKGFRLPPKGALPNPAQQKLEKAIALHQQGRLLEAKFLYDDILKSNPNHFDALHLSGLIAYQGKNLDDALGLFGRAIRIKTSFAPLHSNYGLALQALGRLEEAVASYGKAIKLNPNFAEAYTNRGVALKELGRWDEALASYDKAIRVKPDYAEAYVNRAHALKELKRPDEALASYDMALTIKPGHAENHLSRGVVLRELKRLDEAILSFEMAISIAPNYAEAHFNLGVALHESGRPEEALPSYEKAISLKPDYATAYDSHGIALQALDRRDEALASFRMAIKVKPDYAEGHLNLGVALSKNKQHQQAITLFDQAISLKQDYAEAHFFRGIAFKDMKRFDDALENYEKAISIKPDYVDANWNKCLALLGQGRFAQAWKLYEWRKKTKERLGDRTFPGPLWVEGQDLSGKTLLVHWEQGFGDTIQFCRYVARLHETGARVLFAPQKKLRRLMESLDGAFEFVDENDPALVFDYHVPLLSLPLAFNADLSNIPGQAPYLKADEDRVARWRSVIGTQGFRIGICWQGSVGKIDAGRSFSVNQFHALSQIPGLRLISLHKGGGESQLDTLPPGMVVETLGEDFDAGPDAFADTAAAMRCCDLVISSDTSVAHLAGALGVRSFVALQFVPDWRWLFDRPDCPWYPTMRLFRQPSEGDWDSVFAEIKTTLMEEF